MSTQIIAKRTPLQQSQVAHYPIPKIAHLVIICALMITAIHAHAQEHQGSAKEQYQIDREKCLTGHSDEDQKTCLKEAGAAQDAANHGQLTNADSQFQKDATARCQALGSDDREACMKRMQGQGTVSGSVGSGGILRELVTPIPQPQGTAGTNDSGKTESTESRK
jgi:hypothetical protein